jgi:hypothetical protein
MLNCALCSSLTETTGMAGMNHRQDSNQAPASTYQYPTSVECKNPTTSQPLKGGVVDFRYINEFLVCGRMYRFGIDAA